MIYTPLALALLACSSPLVGAHSWVRCTDYRVDDPTAAPAGLDETDPLRRQYDEDACLGYSPSFPDGTEFGQDIGFEDRPQGDELCLDRDNTYSDSRPMASYTAGETYCVAYPAKNHVASECTNAFLPDTRTTMYRSNLNPSEDSFADMAEFQENELEHLNGEHVLGTVDYLGFQNCPDFCGPDGTDRVLCTMCFTLEDDLAAGTYQFAWDWEFNVGERYSTCWSADVAESTGGSGTLEGEGNGATDSFGSAGSRAPVYAALIALSTAAVALAH